MRVAPAQGEWPEAVTASPRVALRRRDWATLTIIRWEGFETSSKRVLTVSSFHFKISENFEERFCDESPALL